MVRQLLADITQAGATLKTREMNMFADDCISSDSGDSAGILGILPTFLLRNDNNEFNTCGVPMDVW